MAVLLTICEIFSHAELENSHFSPLHSDCRPIAENAKQYQRNLYIAEKYVGYNFVAGNSVLSSFV